MVYNGINGAEFIVSGKTYEAIQTVATLVGGQAIEALAESNPTQAYKVLKDTLKAIAANMSTYTTSANTKVSKGEDGSTTLNAIAVKDVESLMPWPLSGTSHVIISAYSEEGDISTAEPVLWLQVQSE